MKVEELQVLISANADQFTGELVKVHQELKELNKATQAVGKATGKDLFGKILSANVATKALTSTFRGLTRVVGSMSKGVFEGGTQLSRMRIATDTVSTNMGIASDKVDELRDSLAEANTYGLKAEEVINSLARTGLFAMAESLEAVDGRTGETVKGISALVLQMKDLGAVAGTSSSEAIAKITEFINRGNTEMVEGMIAVGNLGTEYRMYAKSIGKARNELTAQEEAEARLMLVHREAEKALGAYANAYTTSGKMIDSIRDATTSIFEEVGSYLEPIFASASSAILTFVSNVRNWLIANAQTFKDWAVKVSAYIIYVVRGIGQLLMGIPALRSFMKNLADFSFPKVETSADNTSKSLGGVNKAMKDTTGSAKSLNKALAGLAGFDEMNVLNPPEGGGTAGLDIGGLGDVPLGAFGDLGELADEVNKKVKELEDTFGTLKERIEKFMEIPVIKWLWENKETILKVIGVLILLTGIIAGVTKVLAIWTPVLTGIIGIGGLIASVFGAVATLIGGLITTGAIVPVLIAALVALLAVAVVTIIRDWDKIKEWFENFFYDLGVWWNEGVEGWKLIIEQITDWIKDKWEDLGNWINGGIEGWGWIFEQFGKIVESVFEWIADAWRNTADFIGERVDRVKNWFSSMWQGVKWGASDAWEGIKRAFGGVANWFANIFSNAWKKVKDVFSSGGAVFKGITDGIFNAFRSVVNSLIRGINTMVSIPFNAINSALRIIRNTKIAGLHPFGWLPTVYAPRIPYLAEGGIVDRPTVAMLGESGREAVIPLQNNTGFIKDLAGAISESGGGDGQGVNLTIKLGEKDLYRGFIDYLNDRSLAGNSKLLKI